MRTRYDFSNGGYLIIDKTGSVNDYNMQTGNNRKKGTMLPHYIPLFFFF